jgi:hypothetical protein
MWRADRTVFEPARVSARLMLPKRLTFSKCSGTHGRSNLAAPTPMLPATWRSLVRLTAPRSAGATVWQAGPS